MQLVSKNVRTEIDIGSCRLRFGALSNATTVVLVFHSEFDPLRLIPK